jgi:hypothetical protein
MKRVALFALVTTVICSSVTDALARGPAAPSFSAPSFRAPSFKAPSFRAPSFRAPSSFIGPGKPFASTLATGHRTARRYIPPGSASANPYDTPAVGRVSPVAVSYASTAQYRSICRIGDSEEGAGGTCRYQTTVSKSRGDKCQCHGQSGTIQ